MIRTEKEATTVDHRLSTSWPVSAALLMGGPGYSKIKRLQEWAGL